MGRTTTTRDRSGSSYETRTMSCGGRGADGTHCCFIGGQVCEFLDETGPVPRCGLMVELGEWVKVHVDRRWRSSPVGRWFKATYPGFGCGDWPQNIPAVMAAAASAGPFYVCCWGRGNDGNLD